MNRYKMFLIENLTNLHVGSGDTHFGIVDNLIQRNPVTYIPVIHSSGIKGALKDYFEEIPYPPDKMQKLFGADESKMESFPGRLIFFEGNLLSIPLRASEKVFYNATSPFVIREYISHIKDFTDRVYKREIVLNWLQEFEFDNNTPFYTFDSVQCPEIEDFRCAKKGKFSKPVYNEIEKILGLKLEDIALFNDVYFRKICERSIPVIARNKIDEDGESENLFYEEFIPRKSRFYFILGEENHLLGREYDNFVETMTKDETIVQFGANYSVGYGFCKVTELKILEGIL
jgi:CRISPR-associated protein Cmr4